MRNGVSRKKPAIDPCAIFPIYVGLRGLPKPESEFKFHPKRKWRVDFVWQAQKIALEVEGAVWVQGRHTRGSGFVKDMEKYNALAVAGYRLLRVTPQQLCTQETIGMLRSLLQTP